MDGKNYHEDYILLESLDYKVGVNEYSEVIYLRKNGQWTPASPIYRASEGYKTKICVYLDGQQKILQLARLVAEAFLPDFNPDHYIYHFDNDASNNHFSNLYQKVK